MEQLLTKQDLAEHWRVTVQTIDSYIRDGLITPCKRTPCKGRFDPKYIAELDGAKLEKHSPLEWGRMERELEYWKAKAKKLEEVFNRMDMFITETRYLEQKEA